MKDQMLQLLWDLSNDTLRIDRKYGVKGKSLADYGKAREKRVNECFASILALFPKPMDTKFDEKRVEEAISVLKTFIEYKRDDIECGVPDAINTLIEFSKSYLSGTLDRPMMSEVCDCVIVEAGCKKCNGTALVGKIPTPEKDFIKDNYDAFLGYYYNSPCSGCPEGHSSMWKTIIESPQWKAWVESRPSYDIPECEELGIISKEHFQDFIKFILTNKPAPEKVCDVCGSKEFMGRPSRCAKCQGTGHIPSKPEQEYCKCANTLGGLKEGKCYNCGKPIKPDVASEFNPQSMDAVVWAKEFMRIYSETDFTDEETMRGWFANAIMAGYDGVSRRNEKEVPSEFPAEIKDIGIDLIEKHFPKGECKERGQAIVLYAELVIRFQELMAEKDNIIKNLARLLEQCKGAISDAIYCEDGLDGSTGEDLIKEIEGVKDLDKLTTCQECDYMIQANLKMGEEKEAEIGKLKEKVNALKKATGMVGERFLSMHKMERDLFCENEEQRAEITLLKQGICEHVAQNIISGDCKLCDLAVADKGYQLWVKKVEGNREALETLRKTFYKDICSTNQFYFPKSICKSMPPELSGHTNACLSCQIIDTCRLIKDIAERGLGKEKR